jgi:cobalt-zinc-cadmium efflux system protein
MLTDVAGVGLALFAMTLAARPATARRSFGYYRAEILAALINAVILLAVSAYILFEAYQRFRDPPEVATSAMVAVASFGLIINLVGVLLLRRDAETSLNMKGAYFEVLSDLLTSIAVIGGGIIMWTTGWTLVDPMLSAGIGLLILPRTYKLLAEAVGVLLEGTPADVDPDRLRETIARVPGVRAVHDLHVWSLTSGWNAMSVHVVRSPDTSGDELLDRVRRCVVEGFPVGHVTIQVEPEGYSEGEGHL